MFKLINLIVAFMFIYNIMTTGPLFEAGLHSAAETGNYSALIYNGTYLILYTLWLVGIYIVVFGSSEVYITTKEAYNSPKESND